MSPSVRDVHYNNGTRSAIATHTRATEKGVSTETKETLPLLSFCTHVVHMLELRINNSMLHYHILGYIIGEGLQVRPSNFAQVIIISIYISMTCL